MRLLYFNFKLTLLFIFLFNDCLAQTSRLGESSISINERRIALVIGMNDYEQIRPLKNPTNDADDMAVTLETLGFGVTKIKNQTNGQLTASINKFINGLRANDVVMFYFSGHGIGYLDDNYLLPTDARIECLEQISAYSISVKRLTADIQSKKVRNCFVVLDACRSLGNLFACSDNQNSKDILTNKGFVIPQNQSRGNIIVYATQAGQTAEDNQKKRNGLFTQELLKNIIIPDLTFGSILSKTTDSVIAESQKLNSYQEPTLYGIRGTDFVFLKNRANANEKEVISNIDNGRGDYLEGEKYFTGDNVPVDFEKAIKAFANADSKGYNLGKYDLKNINRKYCHEFIDVKRNVDDFFLMQMTFKTNGIVKIENSDFWVSVAIPFGGIKWVGPNSPIIKNTEVTIFQANSAIVWPKEYKSYLMIYEMTLCKPDSKDSCNGSYRMNSCYYYHID